MRVLLLAAAAAIAMTGPAEAKKWNAVRRVDKFTDIQSCRVEPGGEFSRSFVRSAVRAGITYHFYAEKRGDEIRAGIFSEPAAPIAGDVQIRVDNNPLITISAADTPIDAAPATPMPNLEALSEQQRRDIETAVRASRAAMSPYRALTGDRAITLLRAVVSGKMIRMRTVAVNGATSSTAEWAPHADLKTAIAACGIVL